MSNSNPELEKFINDLKLDQFCAVASAHRNGLSCQPGSHIVGGKSQKTHRSPNLHQLTNGAEGFNIVQELVFSDGVAWLARIPVPFNCFQPDECTLSYGAILRYIRKNSWIPVREVYDYALRSDPKNPTDSSYVLMERMTGQALPILGEGGDHPDPEALSVAKKVHEQLADIMIELGMIWYCMSLQAVNAKKSSTDSLYAWL